MAAYAVMAHIGRIDPHLTMHDVEEDAEPRPPAGLPDDTMSDVPTVVIDRIPEPGPFAERLARMQELWRQTTFFLFDAESWRA